MGYLLREQGELEEAQLLYREALAGGRRVFGDGHAETRRVIVDRAP